MRTWDIWTIVVWATTAFVLLYPPIYILTGALKRDIRKIRQWWHDTDPDAKSNHR